MEVLLVSEHPLGRQQKRGCEGHSPWVTHTWAGIMALASLGQDQALEALAL